MTHLIEPIPLEKAVLCQDCLCITPSTTDTCDYCKSFGSLMSLARILDRDAVLETEER